MSDLFGDAAIEAVRSGACFSLCRRYRYTLWRKCGPGGTCMFVGLNPSTADETIDDPTIRRCIGFARSWGYGGLMMTNIFAWRATEPSDMLSVADPIGPDNDHALCSAYMNAAIAVAAWGTHGTHNGRDRHVRAMLPKLHCLRLTKNGHPSHPLYLPGNLSPFVLAN